MSEDAADNDKTLCMTEKILVCDKEEHVHDESCYPVKEPEENEPEAEPETTPPEAPSGDPTADLESRAKWESTFSHLVLTGDWAKDVLAIADTQLGYTESASNYITEDGRRKGYTRYGTWYGREKPSRKVRLVYEEQVRIMENKTQ